MDDAISATQAQWQHRAKLFEKPRAVANRQNPGKT